MQLHTSTGLHLSTFDVHAFEEGVTNEWKLRPVKFFFCGRVHSNTRTQQVHLCTAHSNTTTKNWISNGL